MISADSVAAFAEWSRDVNPLHIDPDFAGKSYFGGTIVHGALGALEALGAAPVPFAATAGDDDATDAAAWCLDLEFRGAVYPDSEYSVAWSSDQRGPDTVYRGVVTSGDGETVTIATVADGRFPRSRRWDGSAARPTRKTPAQWQLEDLPEGTTVDGVYDIGPLPDRLTGLSTICPRLSQIFALCSYLVGMELPGLRSLFTRLKLTVLADQTAERPERLHYRARIVRRDERFRMIETELDVRRPDGTPVAHAQIRSYVRFAPAVTPLERLLLPADHTHGLRDKVALVIGGSRGLGADITAALALNGCRHVYATYRSSASEAEALCRRLRERQVSATMIRADAADRESCAAIRQRILAEQGRLDILVLNACAPPPSNKDGSSSTSNYVEQNLPLFEAPLNEFADVVDRFQGIILGVSSSFVSKRPAGFDDYITLKERLEDSLVQANKDHHRLAVAFLRPPRLATSWNDTPTAAAASIPTCTVARKVIARLQEGWSTSDVLTIDRFRVSSETKTEESSPPRHTFRIASTFTAEPLLPALRFWSERLDFDAEFTLAGYGQLLQELLDPGSPLNSAGSGVGLLFVRVVDWLREWSNDSKITAERAAEFLRDTADELTAAIKAHRDRAQTNTILILCPSNPHELASAELLCAIEEDLRQRLSGVPGLTCLRASQHHADYHVPDDAVFDPLRDRIGHIPFTAEYYCLLGTLAARLAYRQLAPPTKLVAVDCDNTLWRGVVGEVGPDGIRLEAQHLRLQRRLVELVDAGVLVALCSKNESDDVWRVFDEREDMILRREHVVAAMIDWQPKSRNLQSLAEKLNLGIDSFVFLDDNPVECAEVRSRCPQILTIQWPQHGEQAVRLLDHLWELDLGDATREDRQRTEMYQQEFRRQELKERSAGFEEFLASLQLEVEFRPLDQQDLGRASQLTRRTNQFNFTTRRRSESELRALAEQPAWNVWTVRVRDRFGDYGIVGLLVCRETDSELVADTFLLSCRTLGRGVEHRMVAWLGAQAGERGLSSVRLEVLFSQRNTPARDFVRSLAREGNLIETESSLDLTLDAEAASRIRFEPSADSDSAPVAAVRATKQVSTARAADWIRKREADIERAAAEWTTFPQLAREILGGADTLPSPEAAAASEDEQDYDSIRQFVVQVFSRELGLPERRLQAEGNLDQLGVDSFKIVEITVGLISRYPELPTTLLFEHRSIDEIAAAIARRTGVPVPRPSIARTTTEPATRERTPAAVETEIAVVGMGVRCAGAGSLEEFWNLLHCGGSAVRKVPARRRGFLGELRDDRDHWAGLIDGLDEFDAGFFGIAPREAEYLDPQLRLVLETAWHALEDAGWASDDLPHRDETGVFVGVMYGDYVHRANLLAQRTGSLYRCWEGFSLANRLSQLMRFHGPSFAVDTACSSSATAVHLACRALANGECRAAVVAGVNLIIDPDRLAALGRLGILSATGNCRPFGEGADGTVIGEGAGAVVLKPLSDALAAGDRIYGVIRGTGLSHGTGTVGFTAPNPQAQAEAIRRALTAARIDPRTVSYIESHGTGTSLGDPIEIRGLELAYLDQSLWNPDLELEHSCVVGALKPNVGHLEAGAGIVGLIKVLLQLRHRRLVPTRTSQSPNPAIPFDRLPFEVRRSATDWQPPRATEDGRPVTIPLRAAVSSFGVGGGNVHIVVEEPPTRLPENRPDETGDVDRRLHVLALSAPDREGLGRLARQLYRQLDRQESVDVASWCHSFNTTRRHFEFRFPVVASDRCSLMARLEDVAFQAERSALESGGAASGKTVLLFTGQGAQFAGMGRELYDTHPVFRDMLDRCNEAARESLDPCLLDVMFAEEGTRPANLLHHTSYTQPALFALEVALAELWRSWGVEPDYLIGHSIGEIAAYCFAGGISLEDGMRLVAARGSLMGSLPAGGTMAAAGCDEPTALDAIGRSKADVSIAAINSPTQTVLSGAAEEVARVTEELESRGIRVSPLKVSHAFHSSLMEPILDRFGEVARQCRFESPRTPLISTRTGTTDAAFDTPEYWVDQIRQPVRFLDASLAALELSADRFIEAGPQPVLLGMLRRTATQREPVPELSAVASLRRGTPAWESVTEAVAQWYRHGGAIDWRGWDKPYRRDRVELPGYPFARKRFWIDESLLDSPSAPSRSSRPRRRVDPRDLLYETNWVRLEATPRKSQDSTRRSWIIVADRRGYGKALADELRRRYGDESVRLERTETESSGDSALADALSAMSDRAGPSGEVHIVVTSGIDSADSNGDRSALRDAMLVTVGALRAAAACDSTNPVRCWLLTCGAAPVADDSDSFGRAAMTALVGLGRTAALESPDQWGGVIDVSSDPAAFATEVSRVCDELTGDMEEDCVAVRGDRRWAPRLVSLESDAGRSFTVNRDGIYWITGGTGALGRHVARWLVDLGARHLVLSSRRGALSTEAESDIAALRADGATIEVLSCDVADRDAVDRTVRQIDALGKSLSGVIHAAGTDQLKELIQLTREDIERLLAPKAAGASNLVDALRGRRLELFVMFSSVAATLGAAGRAHYAAANAFLDGLAIGDAAELADRVLSIAWGPWRGGGMADATTLGLFERVGNFGLEPDVATEALSYALRCDSATVSVADIDWARFRVAYEARRKRPLIEQVEGNGHRTPPADGDGSVSWLDVLQSASPDARRERLAGLLRQAVAEILGFASAEEVSTERHFSEMGMDSLMAVELAMRLRRNLGVAALAIFDHPTIDQLAQTVLEQIDFASEDAGASGGSASDEAVEDRAGGAETGDALEPLGYEPEMAGRIVEFAKRGWPHRSIETVAARWKWMFERSAERLEVAPQVWAYCSADRIVAHMGAIPVELQIGERKRIVPWLVDTMVLEEYRDRALGSQLMIRAKEDCPVSLSLGQTAYVRQILRRLGWRQVTPLKTFAYVINASKLAAGKVGIPGLRQGAATALLAKQLWKSKRRCRPDPHITATPINRFSEEHDRLWDRVSEHYRCCVVRDSRFLNWKYVEQPGQEFTRIELRKGETVCGIVVVQVRPPDEVYRYSRGFVVDMVVDPTDDVAISAACRAAIASLRGRGSDIAVFYLVNRQLEQQIERFGFWEREPTRYLWILTDGMDEGNADMLSQPGNWLVTMGDSDIDRPE